MTTACEIQMKTRDSFRADINAMDLENRKLS